MRIIVDDTLKGQNENGEPIRFTMFHIKDTIEITDAEWDEIGHNYIEFSLNRTQPYKPFSQYLRELLELKQEGQQ